MLLPGGLLRHGELKRRVRLRELDGFLELLIADASRHTGSFHDGVSRVLGGLVDDVEGESFGYEAAGDLCVADRQFLMHRATTLLGMAHHWIATECVECSTRFEVEVDFDVLPVGEAGPGFPFVTVDTEAGPIELRVPTGSDEVAIGAVGDSAEAARALLRRCVVRGELPEVLSASDLARIEAALDEVSPWVVTEVSGSCPACGATHQVALDPYVVMRGSASALYDEVHTLAWHYHWSEAEILALPRVRRQLYLSRVDRARGMTR
jgi:hypothetical protein